MKNLHITKAAKFLEKLQIEVNKSGEDINNFHAGVKNFSARVDELEKQLKISFDALALIKKHISRSSRV